MSDSNSSKSNLKAFKFLHLFVQCIQIFKQFDYNQKKITR